MNQDHLKGGILKESTQKSLMWALGIFGGSLIAVFVILAMFFPRNTKEAGTDQSVTEEQADAGAEENSALKAATEMALKKYGAFVEMLEKARKIAEESKAAEQRSDALMKVAAQTNSVLADAISLAEDVVQKGSSVDVGNARVALSRASEAAFTANTAFAEAASVTFRKMEECKRTTEALKKARAEYDEAREAVQKLLDPSKR